MAPILWRTARGSDSPGAFPPIVGAWAARSTYGDRVEYPTDHHRMEWSLGERRLTFLRGFHTRDWRGSREDLYSRVTRVVGPGFEWWTEEFEHGMRPCAVGEEPLWPTRPLADVVPPGTLELADGRRFTTGSDSGFFAIDGVLRAYEAWRDKDLAQGERLVVDVHKPLSESDRWMAALPLAFFSTPF